MLGVVIDILHWIAGAVLALVGISYDRAADCAPPVLQQTIEEARVLGSEDMIHRASFTYEWEYSVLKDGSVRVIVQPASAQDVSACAQTAGARLPEAPALPVLRL
ncbi:MAG: hypothetical protein ACK4NO_06075 [Glycocaulis sp.]